MTFSINATDYSGNSDSLTYSVVRAPSGVNVTEDGLLSWYDVEFAVDGVLSLQVADSSRTKTEFSVQVGLCNCQNYGKVETKQLGTSKVLRRACDEELC